MNDEQLIQSITNRRQITNPYLSAMHEEADRIQQFMETPASLEDPAAMNTRLNVAGVYIARMERIISDAKDMREQATRQYYTANEEKLAKLTATVSNRMIKTFLYEFNVSVDRFEAMYSALCNINKGLITQLSFIKAQMTLI